MTDDSFKPLTRDDVTDLAGLPRRFDLFVAETRQSFELLAEKIIAPIARIQESITDVVCRLNAMERTQLDHARRLEALEAQARPRKSPRKKARK